LPKFIYLNWYIIYLINTYIQNWNNIKKINIKSNNKLIEKVKEKILKTKIDIDVNLN